MFQNLLAKIWIFACFIVMITATMPDLCNLPSETGMCRAAIRLWFYNAESGNCEEFIWGGCGGNDNRFDSKEKCEQTCN